MFQKKEKTAKIEPNQEETKARTFLGIMRTETGWHDFFAEEEQEKPITLTSVGEFIKETAK